MSPSMMYEEDVYSPLDHHPRTTLIGLHGHAQSGKNTSGDILTEALGYEQISFAEPLKRLALFVNPIVRTSTYGFTWTLQDVFDELSLDGITGDAAWEEAKKVGTTRRFLQKLGEGVREILGENTWVDYAVAKVEEGGKYAFTDTRFENEAQAILDRKGVVVEIKRPGVGPVNDHVSDRRLPEHLITETILNDGDIADLRREVLAVERLAA